MNWNLGNTIKLPTYRLTLDARADLIEIRHYTMMHWGKHQSQKYLVELRRVFRLLSEVPTVGQQQPEIGTEIYSFPYVSHVIYFTLYEQQMVVFGVLHKSMVPANHLDDRSTI